MDFGWMPTTALRMSMVTLRVGGASLARLHQRNPFASLETTFGVTVYVVTYCD